MGLAVVLARADSTMSTVGFGGKACLCHSRKVVARVWVSDLVEVQVMVSVPATV